MPGVIAPRPREAHSDALEPLARQLEPMPRRSPQMLTRPADDPGATDDECRNDHLIVTGRGAEEIDDRDLPLHRIPEPPVIRRVRIGPHEGVVDDIIAFINLLVGLALIVIPNPTASPGEHGSD